MQIPYSAAYGIAATDTFIFGTLLRQEPHIPLEGVRMARKLMYFDSSRAVSELGLTQTPIKEALARAVKWFKENGYTSR
jgi:dihydroflavonol-4-reductase